MKKNDKVSQKKVYKYLKMISFFQHMKIDGKEVVNKCNISLRFKIKI